MSDKIILTDTAYYMNVFQKNAFPPKLNFTLFEDHLTLVNISSQEVLANIPLSDIISVKQPSVLNALLLGTQGINLIIKTGTKSYKISWRGDSNRILWRTWGAAYNILKDRKKTQNWVVNIDKLRG